MLLIGNETGVWYDKTKTPYLYLAPGAAQAGIVINGDWSWRIYPWAHPDQLLHDSLVRESTAHYVSCCHDSLVRNFVPQSLR